VRGRCTAACWPTGSKEEEAGIPGPLAAAVDAGTFTLFVVAGDSDELVESAPESALRLVSGTSQTDPWVGELVPCMLPSVAPWDWLGGDCISIRDNYWHRLLDQIFISFRAG
jgi:hypothetical protein